MAIKIYDLASDGVTQTTDATATVLFSVALAEDKAMHIHADILGAQDDYSDGASIFMWGAFRRASAGNVTQIGSTQGTIQEDSSGTPAIAFNANTSAQTIEIKVTGISSENWNWRGIIRVVEVDS